ncbi:MAG: nuclear transport factor 2 family protein [Polynucleobacter sp.]
MQKLFRNTLCLIICTLSISSPVMADRNAEIEDRINIQEKLLYAYAYAWDNKDCVSWSNLFTADAFIDLTGDVNLASTAKRANGREAIKQFCEVRMKTALADVKSHHYMTNIVFNQITPTSAKTHTYAIVTWQKSSDPIPLLQIALTYRDVIVKQNGKWLLKERHIE